MFCPKCGKELDANNVCINPTCPSNSETTSEFGKKETSTNNDSTIGNVENNETINQNHNNNPNDGYSQNPNYNPNNGYNQNSNNGQNNGYNQTPNFGQNAGYNQNNNYNQGNSFTDNNGISSGEMMDFFGPKNTEYYMEKWNRNQENPSFTSWNWPAFFFSWIWLCYRKMYSYAAIVFVVVLIAEIMLPRWAYSITNLGIMIASGLLANQIYIKNTIDKIRTAKVTTGMNPQALSQRLRAIGGITWVPVIIISVLFVIFILLIIIVIASIGSSFRNFY